MADYRLNRKGTAAMLRSGMMHEATERKAREAMAYAKSISPRGPAPYHYANQFHVENGVSVQSDRAASYLVNTAPYAMDVEERHKVLARTIDAVNDKKPGR